MSEIQLLKPQFNLLFFCIELPFIGAYRKGKIPDFCSSALSKGLSKVTALRWDLTTTTTVEYYTFISRGSVTPTSCLQN